MKVKLVRPSADFPLAWVHVDLKTDLGGDHLTDILRQQGYTLLGRWEVFAKDDTSEFRAPVLIESEHVKPKARRRR